MYYKTNPFYHSKEWRRLRKEILKTDKCECQTCKAQGMYTEATHVHHVNYLDKHPELALEKYYKDKRGETKRNLISLCHNCHEKAHKYRQKPKEKPLTKERW